MISFDDSMWPLLTVTFSGSISGQDVDSYLTKLSTYLNRGEKFLVILDTSPASNALSLEQRQRQVEWIRKNDSALRQRLLGCAFVITSPFIRLAMNIILQLSPFPFPYTIVGDVKVARAWTGDRCRAAGIPNPLLPKAQPPGSTGTQGSR